MCQRDTSISSRSNRSCEPNIKNEVLSKKELLMWLKEYKKSLESELAIVNSELKLGDELPERR